MKKKFTNVNIIHDIYEHITREADPDDCWDRNSTAQTHEFRGLEVVEHEYSHFKVPFSIEYEKPYYLVVVYYDTGDSFGHDENRADLIELYDNIEFAQKTVNIINNSYTSEEYSSEILNCEGKPLKIFNSWQGYFEHLNYVDIITLYRK